jgi:membrane-associated phospholipid phosphatase
MRSAFERSILGGAIWFAVPIAVVVTAIALYASGLGLVWRSLVVPAAIASGLGALFCFYALKRPDPAICAMTEVATYLFVLVPPLALLDYGVATLDRPLCDGLFATIDAAIGFDWIAHLAWVHAEPWLGIVLSVAYKSSMAQIALVILVLSFLGRFDRLREFVQLFLVTAIATTFVSGALPAAGAYVHYAPPAELAVGLDPRNGIWHLHHFEDLRNGLMTKINLDHVEGLVTFPSFHTMLAIITAWAVRAVRYVATPVAFLNALVILSTLSIGGHYLIDVIVAAAMTGIAIAALYLPAGLPQSKPRPQTA